MTEAEAFKKLEAICNFGHGNTVRKRRDCQTCQILMLIEVTAASDDRATKAERAHDVLMLKWRAVLARAERLAAAATGLLEYVRFQPSQFGGAYDERNISRPLTELHDAIGRA